FLAFGPSCTTSPLSSWRGFMACSTAARASVRWHTAVHIQERVRQGSGSRLRLIGCGQWRTNAFRLVREIDRTRLERLAVGALPERTARPHQTDGVAFERAPQRFRSLQ